MSTWREREKALEGNLPEEGGPWEPGTVEGMRRALDEGTPILVLWHDGWRRCDVLELRGAEALIKTPSGGRTWVSKLSKATRVRRLDSKLTRDEEMSTPF